MSIESSFCHDWKKILTQHLLIGFTAFVKGCLSFHSIDKVEFRRCNSIVCILTVLMANIFFVFFCFFCWVFVAANSIQRLISTDVGHATTHCWWLKQCVTRLVGNFVSILKNKFRRVKPICRSHLNALSY